MSLEIQGERELLIRIGEIVNDVEKAKKDALAKAGMRVVAKAQQNLIKNKNYNTGQLAQSARVQYVDGTIEAGFFSQGTDEGHAAVLEYGSNKTWYPPKKALYDWAHGKFGTDKKTSWAIAISVCMTIAGINPKYPNKHGLSPHPFFAPALATEKGNIENIIGSSLGKVMNK